MTISVAASAAKASPRSCRSACSASEMVLRRRLSCFGALASNQADCVVPPQHDDCLALDVVEFPDRAAFFHDQVGAAPAVGFGKVHDPGAFGRHAQRGDQQIDAPGIELGDAVLRGDADQLDLVRRAKRPGGDLPGHFDFDSGELALFGAVAIGRLIAPHPGAQQALRLDRGGTGGSVWAATGPAHARRTAARRGRRIGAPLQLGTRGRRSGLAAPYPQVAAERLMTDMGGIAPVKVGSVKCALFSGRRVPGPASDGRRSVPRSRTSDRARTPSTETPALVFQRRFPAPFSGGGGSGQGRFPRRDADIGQKLRRKLVGNSVERREQGAGKSKHHAVGECFQERPEARLHHQPGGGGIMLQAARS